MLDKHCCRYHAGYNPSCRDGYVCLSPDWDTGRSLFIVCVDCGNKRCPKATDCRLECTGSNAPNQPGSYYFEAE